MAPHRSAGQRRYEHHVTMAYDTDAIKNEVLRTAWRRRDRAPAAPSSAWTPCAHTGMARRDPQGVLRPLKEKYNASVGTITDEGT